MYIIDKSVKSDPVRRWNLPDRVFFAAGACHILAYAFIERYSESKFRPKWIKPTRGYSGNHIVAVNGNIAFDYHGYSEWCVLLDHTLRKANRWWLGWNCELVDLPIDVLVSEKKSRQFDGLWLREPTQFLHDALPRARRFLDRYSHPRTPETGHAHTEAQPTVGKLAG